jgi:hypothetical protein
MRLLKPVVGERRLLNLDTNDEADNAYGKELTILFFAVFRVTLISQCVRNVTEIVIYIS